MPAVQPPSPSQHRQQEREAQLQLLDRCRRCAQQADAVLAAVDARLAGGAERVRAVHDAVAGPARYPLICWLTDSPPLTDSLMMMMAARTSASPTCARA